MSADPHPRPLTKRLRHRRGYVREAGGHTAWTEWQVLDGRKVIARFDFESQADGFIASRATPVRPE